MVANLDSVFVKEEDKNLPRLRRQNAETDKSVARKQLQEARLERRKFAFSSDDEDEPTMRTSLIGGVQKAKKEEKIREDRSTYTNASHTHSQVFPVDDDAYDDISDTKDEAEWAQTAANLLDEELEPSPGLDRFRSPSPAPAKRRRGRPRKHEQEKRPLVVTRRSRRLVENPGLRRPGVAANPALNAAPKPLRVSGLGHVVNIPAVPLSQGGAERKRRRNRDETDDYTEDTEEMYNSGDSRTQTHVFSEDESTDSEWTDTSKRRKTSGGAGGGTGDSSGSTFFTTSGLGKQRPLTIRAERVHTRDRRFRLTTLDVLLQYVVDHVPRAARNDIIAENVVLDEFKAYLAHHVRRLLDLHAATRDICADIADVQRRKNAVRQQILAAQRRHAEVGAELERVRHDYAEDKRRHAEMTATVSAFGELKAAVGAAGGQGKTEQEEEMEEMEKVEKELEGKELEMMMIEEGKGRQEVHCTIQGESHKENSTGTSTVESAPVEDASGSASKPKTGLAHKVMAVLGSMVRVWDTRTGVARQLEAVNTELRSMVEKRP